MIFKVLQGYLPALLILSLLFTKPVIISDFTLDNGLHVIIAQKHGAPVATTHLWYDVGSHDEWDGIRGTAHFFEHMMFKGSKRFPTNIHEKIIESLGGEENAWTSDDHTVYYNKVPSEHIGIALELEADRMRNLIINQDVIDTERQVVKEEFRERNSDPISKEYYRFRKIAYPKDHPYYLTPLGSMDQLDTISVQTFQKFYDMYYGPDNAVLVVAGDVKPDKIKNQVKKLFGNLEPVDAPKTPSLVLENKRSGEYSDTFDFDIPVTSFGFYLPPASHSDIPAITVLSYILGSGDGAVLNKHFIDDTNLAVFTEAYPDIMSGTGIYSYMVGYFPSKKPKDIKNALFDMINRLIADGISDIQLASAKKQIVSETIFERFSVNSIASSIGYAEVELGDWSLYDKAIDRYNRVTVDDINRVLALYFQADNVVIYNLNPRHISFFHRVAFSFLDIFQ